MKGVCLCVAKGGGVLNDKRKKDKRQQHQERQVDPSKINHFSRINQFYNDNKHLVDEDAIKKLKKTPLALLFAYIGTGYNGLEYRMSNDAVGLENVLEQALFKAGMILPSNLGDPSRIKWNRSSRTDKGVHSLCTLITANLEISTYKVQGEVEDVVVDVGVGVEEVGEQVVVELAAAEATTIITLEEYMQPQFIGNHSYHNFTMHRKTYKGTLGDTVIKQQHKDSGHDAAKSSDDEEGEEAGELTKGTSEWMSSPMERDIELAWFSLNPRNMRKIYSFKLVELPTKDGDVEPLVRFEIHGESFIQYQIRKMIGFVLALSNGYCKDTRIMEMALCSPYSVRSPIAPATPLYLFDMTLKERTSTTPMQLFDKSSTSTLKEQFCVDQLYPHLADLNRADPYFDRFIDELRSHLYTFENQDIDNLYANYLGHRQEFEANKLLRQQKRKDKATASKTCE
ncbi:hypothetical protein SAMD00019534_014110 [Acytostelium subglobosum LB1]|uniref:hypothetical protein n=1 Tax=Acytostelium subglobosum LB1 TaxID=1410327 RepID=UPI00064497ED|nr:hypothetical protein SAMD00019534_014110 [Acytostelium subglobosum LB1]GAM18236.1 hypothetical protein SAMD00019534_014110 [Acytostelium subglobosum LB1]|eukprot:XP_012758832.1 hypothetical protein SAMD00019534_014110 [Acytostelium subglobosum LB1]